MVSTLEDDLEHWQTLILVISQCLKHEEVLA